jgi:putative peptide zinc metalloprotease protein
VEILPGPADPDGSPTWILHDPARSRFEKAHWEQIEVLRRLATEPSAAAVVERLRRETTIRATVQEIESFCRGLIQRGLTVESSVSPAAELARRRRLQHPPWWQWLAHRYLFFRVPLLRPDSFLERTYPSLRWLCSAPLLSLYVLAGLLGLYLLLQRPEEYLSTFAAFLSWQGLLAYAVALSLVRLVHEFAHAYAAKAAGSRVPEMGVAFMVLWPIPYTDVTDTWRLASRRQRLRISLAGVFGELIIAGLALLVWGASPPGPLRGIAFVISSVSLLSSLVVNLNPAMRFDGYYVLSDLLGEDNLQARAFAVTRWAYRRLLLGLADPPPDPPATRRRRMVLIAYSIYAWVYRFFLYLGIALLVYSRFTKLLGIALFVMEISFFILRPVVREVRSLWQLRHRIGWNPRSIGTALVLVLLLLWLALPLPRRLTAPAVLQPAREQALVVPAGGRLSHLHAGLPGRVEAGTLLLRVESRELRQRLRLLRLEVDRLKVLRRQAARPGRDEHLARLGRRLARARAALLQARAEEEQLSLRADFSGEVVRVSETLRRGAIVAADAEVARLADVDHLQIVALIGEDSGTACRPGATVRFYPHSGGPPATGQVVRLQPVSPEQFRRSRLRWLLPAAVRQEGPGNSGRATAHGPAYQVYVQLQAAPAALRAGQGGRLSFVSEPRSLAARLLQRLYAVLVRESNL